MFCKKIRTYNFEQLIDVIFLKVRRLIFFILNKPFYHELGMKSAIVKPVRIVGRNNICIERNVLVRTGAYLYANSSAVKETLKICEGVNVGHYSHIVANYKVIIERNVLLADRVFITDCSHSFDDINLPIIKQKIVNTGETIIGENSWIGEGVSIVSAKIGRHCVIGANSVVVNDIPDYCIAVGNPARIIKKYDLPTNTWRKVYE